MKNIDEIKTGLIIKKKHIRDEKIKGKNKQLKRYLKSEISNAKINAKREIMNQRSGIIKNIISEGINRFLHSKEYQTLIESEIKNHYSEGTAISGNKEDQTLKDCASKIGASIGHVDIKGGIIFHKNSIYINKSIDATIEKDRILIEKKLSETLFS